MRFRTLLLLALLWPAVAAAQAEKVATAVFAGGCFWCVEAAFDKLPGVVATISGYTGGRIANPSYEQVSGGGTGHLEAVEVRYDPARVSYEKLLQLFWHNIDPLDAGGQFCDRGEQYSAAIFVADDAQRRLAEASKQTAAQEKQAGGPIVTRILPAAAFYPAEEYHQDYYRKNPVRYRFYRTSCGRDRRLEEVWGKKGRED